MIIQEHKTILLVEDETLIAMAVEKTLQKFGYHVIIASTGEKAIEKMRNVPDIDLILMDINLGKGMDGTDAAEIILKNHDAPVVFLSSHTEKDVVEKTEKITSYGYIVKGSGETVLLASIKMAFKLYDAHQGLKQREEALKWREKTLQAFFNAVHESMTLIDTKGTILLSNAVGAQRLGKTVPEFVGTCLYDWFPPDVACYRKEHYEKVVDTGKPVYFQDTRLERFFEQYCYPVFDEKRNVSGVAIFARDITESKLAEKALKRSEQKYRNIFKNVVEGIFQTTPEGRFLTVNPSFARIFGYSLPEELIETITDIGRQVYVNSDKRDEFLRIIQEKGIIKSFELHLKKKDGSTFWASVNAYSVYDENGTLLYYEGTSEDITERKRMEEELRRMNLFLDSIVENIPNMIFLKDAKELRFVRFNRAGEDLMGHSREGLMGKNDYDFFPKEQANFFTQKDREVLCGKEVIDIPEEPIQTRNKGERILHTKKVPILDAKGEPEYLLGISVDITERKQAEEALFNEKEKLLILSENAPFGMALIAKDGQFLYINPKYRDIFGYDLSDTPDGKTWFRKAHHDANYRHEVISAWLDDLNNAHYGEQRPRVFNVTCKDGSTKAISFITVLLWNGDNIMVCEDITDRKQAEEKIQKLLSEKELLLKEVHHRIKNNMNVIMSLLSLQSSTLSDPSAISSLEDARSRVQSMMVLYDKLYQSVDFREISTKEYLTSLIDEIVMNFPNRGFLKIEKQIDNIILDAKVLSPVGIILNELLTNAMKHAFIGRNNRLIGVSFLVKDNHVTLMVQDNGAGIPESIDIATTTGFGLQLVGILTEQLEGTIRIERENGPRFVLEFEV